MHACVDLMCCIFASSRLTLRTGCGLLALVGCLLPVAPPFQWRVSPRCVLMGPHIVSAAFDVCCRRRCCCWWWCFGTGNRCFFRSQEALDSAGLRRGRSAVISHFLPTYIDEEREKEKKRKKQELQNGGGDGVKRGQQEDQLGLPSPPSALSALPSAPPSSPTAPLAGGEEEAKTADSDDASRLTAGLPSSNGLLMGNGDAARAGEKEVCSVFCLTEVCGDGLEKGGEFRGWVDRGSRLPPPPTEGWLVKLAACRGEERRKCGPGVRLNCTVQFPCSTNKQPFSSSPVNRPLHCRPSPGPIWAQQLVLRTPFVSADKFPGLLPSPGRPLFAYSVILCCI